MDTANQMATAFEAEAGTAPVVNVSGVDAPTVEIGIENEPTRTQKFYTEEDLAKVRSQEKSKVYPEIQSLKEKVALLEKEKEEKAARIAEEEAEKAAELSAKAKAQLENDLDAKELLKVKEQEWQEQLARERQEREAAFALLERERQFADLQAYRQQIIEQERDNIMPQLLKYLEGNTPEELAASAEDLKAQTASIMGDVQTSIQNARKEMPGTRATLPASGLLDTNSDSRQFTAQDIASMSVNEYAKVRDKLISDRARGKTSGILG